MSAVSRAAVARRRLPPRAVAVAERRLVHRFVDMRSGTRWLIGVGLCLAVKLHPAAVDAQGAPHEFREVHLGMEMRIVVVHADQGAAAAMARRAFDGVEAHEAVLSDWRPESEVRRLEHAAAGEWVAISASLGDVLAVALLVAGESGGAFDPTVGPLTALWREARTTGTPVDETLRARAMTRVGHWHVELDTLADRVRFAVAGMRLDLGGVAKGWILDRALEVLIADGASAALVEAGGDVVVRGAPPGAAGWRIRVPRPQGDTVLILDAGAVSSSGSLAQRIAGVNGATESHVVNPESGRGVPGDETVTVVGPSGAIADALATALSLTAPARRERLAARFGVTLIAPSPAQPPAQGR
jgi:thiamine biosynthesis lipoprotein